MPKVTAPQVVNYVKATLGYPSVDIEVADSVIEAHLGVALLFISPYYAGTFFLDKAYSPVIDLSADNVEQVVSVYETTPSISDDYLDNSAFGLQYYSLSNANAIQLAVDTMSRSEAYSSVPRNFRFIDGKLYVYGYGTSSITLECLKTLDDITELRDPYMLGWVFKYTLALTKITLGNIRRKFSISSNPVTLDGDAMASEGASERSDLEGEIRDGSKGLFFVER